MDEFTDGVIATKRIWAARPLLVAYVVATGFTIGLLVNRAPGGDRTVTALAGGEAGHSAEAAQEIETKEEPLWMQVFRPSQATARMMLRLALPMLAAADSAAQENRSLVVYWSGKASQKPQTIFQAVLPFLQSESGHEEEPAPPPQAGQTDGSGMTEPLVGVKPPVSSEPPKPSVVNNGRPLVGIYHTHDWESYLSEFPGMQVSSNKDLIDVRSDDHKKRTVVELGRLLAQTLWLQHGVAAVHAPGTHQNLSYDFAYDASRVTAKRILSEYPSVKILIDVHRDGTYGANTTAVIGGQKVARLRCIIGLENESHWQQNRAFCDAVIKRLEEAHPGITLETRNQRDRYNQDLLPGGILFEIGGAQNSYDEAQRAIGYLAEALGQVIKDGAYPH